MRWMCLFTIVALASISGCSDRGGGGESKRVKLSDSQDQEFKDFSQNWHQFISRSTELTIPVVASTRTEPAAPEPIIFSACVPSSGVYVPQVTISWNESPGQVIETKSATAQRQGEAPVRRFDLGLHHDPFTRNFYSSVLSTDKLKRFNLPSNSALVNNPQAVLSAGAGLFPRLMDYKMVVLQDTKTNRQIVRQTVVIRELNPGVSYSMRVSRLVGREWSVDRHFVFVPPVCTNSL